MSNNSQGFGRQWGLGTWKSEASHASICQVVVPITNFSGSYEKDKMEK